MGASVDPARDCPPCPKCDMAVGTPATATEKGRWDGLDDANLWCPSCGAGWVGTVAKLTQATASWRAYEDKQALRVFLSGPWSLGRGDCLAGLPLLPDRSVDCIITDPPYSAHVHAKSRRGLTVTHVPGARDEISERRDLGFEHITPEQMQAAAAQFARVARRWVLVFCDERSDHLWRAALESAGLEYLRTCWWRKLGGAPQFTGDRPAVPGESIVCAHRPGRKRWNGGGKQGFYSVPTAIDRDRSGLDARVHTTQKPVRLMEALLLDFTDPGELVCDPFAGSGTTGVAALRLGRRFVGWERDAECHRAATERLTGTRALPTGYHGARAQGALL